MGIPTTGTPQESIMFRVLTAKIEQHLGFGFRGLATRGPPSLSSRVPLVPQPQDVVEPTPSIKPPLLPSPDPKVALPKPPKPEPVKEPISHEDRVHNPGNVPINILSH